MCKLCCTDPASVGGEGLCTTPPRSPLGSLDTVQDSVGHDAESEERKKREERERHYYLYEIKWDQPKYGKWLSCACHEDYVSFLNGSPVKAPENIKDWIWASPTEYLEPKAKTLRIQHGTPYKPKFPSPNEIRRFLEEHYTKKEYL